MSPHVVRGLVAAAAAVGVIGLAACGDETPYEVPDRFEAYCEAVEEQQIPISDALADGGEATGLIRALPSFEALAAEAPDDIADEWEVVIDRINDLVDALDAAGVDPESYDRRHPPAGLEKGDKQAIDAAASALVSPTTAGAMAGVQQHARDVCKTQLAL